MNQIHKLTTWKVFLLISVLSALTPVISGSMLLKKTTQRRREANTSNPRARLQRVKAESRKRYLKKKHKKRKLIIILDTLATKVLESNNDLTHIFCMNTMYSTYRYQVQRMHELHMRATKELVDFWWENAIMWRMC